LTAIKQHTDKLLQKQKSESNKNAESTV